MGESQPQVGLLVMPARVTVLMAVSHPDKQGWRGKCLHLGHLLAGWRAVRHQHSALDPHTVGTRGLWHHLELEKGDTVLRCLAGMPGWEIGD